jgi:hypothetical protein
MKRSPRSSLTLPPSGSQHFSRLATIGLNILSSGVEAGDVKPCRRRDDAATLESRLPVATGQELRRLPQFIRDLESKRFAEREQTQAALERMGPEAEPALRQALAGTPSPEARRRLEALLTAPAFRCPEKLRRLRAISTLEQIGSAHARRALESLRAGEPSALETRQAKAALQRLTRLKASGSSAPDSPP